MGIGSTVRARSGGFRLSARSVRGPEAGSLERVRRPSSLDASQRAAPRDVPSPAAGARLPTSAVGGVTFGRTSASSRRHRPRAGHAHRGVLRCHEHTDPPSLPREPGHLSPRRPTARAAPTPVACRCDPFRLGGRTPPPRAIVSTASATESEFRFNGLRPDSMLRVLVTPKATSVLRPTPRIWRARSSTEHADAGWASPYVAARTRVSLRDDLRALKSPSHSHVVGDGGTDLTRLTHGDEPVDRTGRRRLQRHRDGRSSGWLGRPSICGPALHAGQPRPKSEASIVPRRARPRRRGATDSEVLFHVKHRPATEVEEEPVSEARSIRPRCGGVAPGTRSTDDLTRPRARGYSSRRRRVAPDPDSCRSRRTVAVESRRESPCAHRGYSARSAPGRFTRPPALRSRSDRPQDRRLLGITGPHTASGHEGTGG